MKDCVLFLGRFQSAMHSGHTSVINQMIKDNNSDTAIIIGIVNGKKSSMDKKKNPFSFELRKDLINGELKELSKKNNVDYSNVIIVEIPTGYIPDIAENLEKIGYNLIKIYCGSDRVSSYQKICDPLGIKVVEIKRDETNENDTVESASATKIRQTLSENNFDDFKKYMPDFDEDYLKDVYMILRQAYKESGNAIKESVILSGISHIDSIDVDEFIDMLKNFYKLHISEKLDGTFNMSVQKKDNHLNYVRLAKKQSVPFTADILPKTPIYNALRSACYFLDNDDVNNIIFEHLKENESIDIEVLFGAQPNSIRYDLENNMLALLRYIDGPKGDEGDKAIDELYNKLKNIKVNIEDVPIYYYDWNDEEIKEERESQIWSFTKPEILTDEQKSVYNSADEDIKLLEEWLNKSSTIIPEINNLQALSTLLTAVPKNERPKYKEAREKANEEAHELKLNIKQKMIDTILKSNNFKISKNNAEGVVMRYGDTGKMIKLVDKEGFRKNNETNWQFMERAGNGFGRAGEFEDGIIRKFFKFLAETLNIKMMVNYAKLFKQFKNGSGSIQSNIHNYIENNDLAVNNLDQKITLIKSEIKRSMEALKKLNEEAQNSEQINEFTKKRTSNSIGLYYGEFKRLYNMLDNNDTLEDILFKLFKCFTNNDE